MSTVGKISSDLIIKSGENTHCAEEQMREQLTDYDKGIHECIDRSLKEYPNNFYIVVITKKERLLANVIRNYFFARISCPTPDYDQAVYYYDRDNQKLEFLWVLPARDICAYMLDFRNGIHKEEFQLLKFVIDFLNGTLDKLTRKRNKELVT